MKFILGIHTDIDECTEDVNVDCGPNADCNNNPGSYTCDCFNGYEMNDNNQCEGEYPSVFCLEPKIKCNNSIKAKKTIFSNV